MVRVFVWAKNLLDTKGDIRLGGVQTYLTELTRVLNRSGYDATIIALSDVVPFDAGNIFSVSSKEWEMGSASSALKNKFNFNKNDIHIFGDVHSQPKQIPSNSIGIQHGILWDRPNTKYSFLPGIFRYLIGGWRNYKGSRIIHDFGAIVCVDLVFPTNAACVMSGLDWEKVHYIPNFAPSSNIPENLGDEIDRIVFSRRFVEQRGTKIMVEAVQKVIISGWRGKVCFFGGGPLEEFIRAELGSHKNVLISKLDYKDRMQAFDEKTIVVVPSLSTEGTSLSLIEGWSKGAFVISTGVGGLSNLIIDQFNALFIKPTSEDLFEKLMQVIEKKVDVRGIKLKGIETQQKAFNEDLWTKRWVKVIEHQVMKKMSGE